MIGLPRGLANLKILSLEEWMRPQETLDQVRTAGSSYGLVPWVYRCSRMRANAVASIPFTVHRVGAAKGTPPVTVEEYPFLRVIPRLKWLTEASLGLHGAAYWFHEQNRVKTLGLRWMAPQTIQPEYDPDRGLLGFHRVMGGGVGTDRSWERGNGPELRVDHGQPLGMSSARRPALDPGDVVYFWLPDPDVEIGPGRCPGDVTVEDAALARNVVLWAKQFFGRGAIPSVILSFEGNPSDAEIRKVEAWWKRTAQGLKNAWSTIGVRASLKPIVIGAPAKDLAMGELNADTRQRICCGWEVPVELLQLGATYSNQQEMRKGLYAETAIPQNAFIDDTMNEQLLSRRGLEIRSHPEQLEVMQEDEVQRAGALVTLRNAGLPLDIAMEILGYDMSEETEAKLKAYISNREFEYARARTRKDAEAAKDPVNLLRHLLSPKEQSLGDNGLGQNLEL